MSLRLCDHPDWLMVQRRHARLLLIFCRVISFPDGFKIYKILEPIILII